MALAEEAKAIREAEARYKRGDAAALEDIYAAARRVAAAQIARQAQTKGFALSAERQEEKAHDAASYCVEQYITRPGFSLRKPQGYIRLRVLHELYRSAKRERREARLDEAGE